MKTKFLFLIVFIFCSLLMVGQKNITGTELSGKWYLDVEGTKNYMIVRVESGAEFMSFSKDEKKTIIEQSMAPLSGTVFIFYNDGKLTKEKGGNLQKGVWKFSDNGKCLEIIYENKPAKKFTISAYANNKLDLIDEKNNHIVLTKEN